DGLEAIDGLLAQFVGDGGGAVGVVAQGDLFGTAGVFAGDRAALVVIGPGGVADAAFVGDAGEEFGVAGVFVVVLADKRLAVLVVSYTI
ncbi:hypothetical protein BZL41_12190, partial [Pseudomonas sp. PIC25]